MLENLGAKIPKSQNKTCSALLQTVATGELEGDYRRIVYIVQENRLGPTGKLLGGYRKIRFGILDFSVASMLPQCCLNVGSKVWAVKREKGGFQGGFGRKKGW